MRDTQALRAAREAEIDPYRRRFTWPKWNRTVTAIDVPQLFRRLPEFASWTRARHEALSRAYLDQYLADCAVYADLLTRYERIHGTAGSLISGGFYSSWPEYARDSCRYMARRTSDFADRSFAHWQAAGRQDFTWRRLRDVCRELGKSAGEIE